MNDQTDDIWSIGFHFVIIVMINKFQIRIFSNSPKDISQLIFPIFFDTDKYFLKHKISLSRAQLFQPSY